MGVQTVTLLHNIVTLLRNVTNRTIYSPVMLRRYDRKENDRDI